ncbi:hypothetical protein [Acaryochloris sp. CCMEE 5410]|nr:hypothetical protein [Acaryochloris sp. CCMEE 5410]KAI9132687.1 hypothetical protein ON05_004525 [Acaryochloris sp. CCMEE 5410]
MSNRWLLGEVEGFEAEMTGRSTHLITTIAGARAGALRSLQSETMDEMQ